VLRVDARHSFGGQGGWIGDVSFYSPLAGSEQYFIFAGPSLTFADNDNMRHNYGVCAAQSRASGYAQYNASGGIQSGSFAVTGGYFFTKHWLVESALAAQKLFGPAGYSSFVQERVQLASTLSLDYRW
jgi:outer membrane scaffolding protein for murein synthesis (MipA/OmpV family)